MRTICFANKKGGVGKTTISTHAAYLAAVRGNPPARVLFIDIEGQGDATGFFGVPRHGIPSICDILSDGVPARDIIRKTKYDNIDIIPSNDELDDYVIGLTKDQDIVQQDVLLNALKGLEDEYDLCIIDCPPAYNFLVLSAFRVADSAVVVSIPHIYSEQGVEKFNERVRLAQSLNPAFHIDGVLLNSYRSCSSSHHSIERIEQDTGLPVFAEKIRYTAYHLEAAAESGRSVFEQSPSCGFCRDMENWFFPYINGEAEMV